MRQKNFRKRLSIGGDVGVDRKILISHHFPLDAIHEPFETQGKREAVKVMIDIPQVCPDSRGRAATGMLYAAAQPIAIEGA